MATTRRRPKKGERAAFVPDKTNRLVILHLMGSVDYALWLQGVHEKTGFPKTKIFRDAVLSWAEKNGFDKPPYN